MNRKIIFFPSLFISSFLFAQINPSVSMDIASQQIDSPVIIVSTTSSATYMFDSVQVINRSDRVISSITLALSMEEPDSKKNNEFSVRLKSSPVRLEAKSKATLDSIGYSGKDLSKSGALAKMSAIRATIGVVEVEFLDGGRWTYEIELQHRNKFPSKDSLRAMRDFGNDSRVKLLLGESCSLDPNNLARPASLSNTDNRFKLAPAFQGGSGYFTCADAGSQSCIYCTNANTSCSVSICPGAPGGSGPGQSGVCFNCAKQTCAFHLPA